MFHTLLVYAQAYINTIKLIQYNHTKTFIYMYNEYNHKAFLFVSAAFYW